MARRSEQPFVLRKSDIQGRGAFATRLIRRGQRIIEYTGERIGDDEADRRYDDEKMSRHHTFLFVVDDKVIVDAAVGGNDSRFINHSCDPNCEAVIERKRIFIYALKTIRPGEELAYDYQYERTKDHTDEDEQFYACKCGAPNCRGTILAPEKKKRKKSATTSTKTSVGKGRDTTARRDALRKAKTKTKASRRRDRTSAKSAR